MKELVIVGAGGFAKEVLWLIRDFNRDRETPVRVLGFVTGGAAGSASARIAGLPVLGDDGWAFQQLDRDVRFVVAVGAPQKRRGIAAAWAEQGFHPTRLVHPSVCMGDEVQVGAGSILCAGAILTTDIEVGAHAIVNLNATIGHDCRIGDYVTVHPGANISGNVHIGEGCEIGTGASVLPGLRIGAETAVGAGAAVTKDLEGGGTWVGVPARQV